MLATILTQGKVQQVECVALGYIEAESVIPDGLIECIAKWKCYGTKVLDRFGLAALITACSVPDEVERLANQGLPQTGFFGDNGIGRQLHSKSCASCHGLMMSGSKQGPALDARCISRVIMPI